MTIPVSLAVVYKCCPSQRPISLDPCRRGRQPDADPGPLRNQAIDQRIEAVCGPDGIALGDERGDEALTDEIHALTPYAANGRRDVTNARDGIFQSGDKSVLSVTKRNGGYAATFDIALDLSAAVAGRPDRGGGRGRSRGGP